VEGKRVDEVIDELLGTVAVLDSVQSAPTPH
jgi:hypothetical protein